LAAVIYEQVDFSKIAPSTNSFKRMMCMSAASGPGEEPTISSLLYVFASADMAGWEFKVRGVADSA
jgi:hypothetical protein